MSALTGWLSLGAGSLGVVATLLLYAVRTRFRGGTIGQGFGIWVLALLVWAASMLQIGAMTLFAPHELAGLIHHVLMVGGLGLGLVGSYLFYRIPLR